MARIQVFCLPSESLGEASSTPFALIIDQAADLELDEGSSLYLDQFASRVGARGVLVIDKTLDIG